MNIQMKMAWAGLLLIASSAFGVAQAELAIIAHPSQKVVGVSQDNVSDIYLGRSKTFPNGAVVEAVDQDSASASYQQFLGKVLKMDAAALKSYWAKRIFSGKAKPPRSLGDDEAVKKWVAANPNGLGYVQGKFVDSSVKVLLIIP
jgi:ABC-type phosphate transport system substrate-binding protein